MNSQIALPTTAADLVDEYDRKERELDDRIKLFQQHCTDFEASILVRGTFAESVFSAPSIYPDRLRKNLLQSGWKAVYSHLQIDRLASAKDKKLFDQGMANPPPLTLDNVKATFGDYFLNTRHHILRGLAEVFVDLDPAYKSHSKVRIGKKGLPKRIILNWGSYYHSYGFDKFVDVVNALAALQGIKPFNWSERTIFEIAHGKGEDAILDGRTYERKKSRYSDEIETFKSVNRGLRIRKFANGNVHIFFEEPTLTDINLGLAEFYGEVLPDVDPDNPTKAPSTAVSKDLQFYASPKKVIDAALDFAEIHTTEYYRGDPPKLYVLEPSCGDGRILDELRLRGCRVTGVEYHRDRATQARNKGHNVYCKNFLEMIPVPDFDKIVMNPPFYGRHYVKHVRHAMKFLKPGGTLVAILPASARYDHKELDDLADSKWNENWKDLPPGSFSEVGTNIPTILLRAFAPKEA